jgi:hypothetical protein
MESRVDLDHQRSPERSRAIDTPARRFRLPPSRLMREHRTPPGAKVSR